MSTELWDGRVQLLTGDARDHLGWNLRRNSVDALVSDPPYALESVVKRFGKASAAPARPGKDGLFQRQSKGFMGKAWDTGEVAHDAAFWRTALDVMKPGAHLVAFGGTRTYHRLACAIEDAGFEIRDQLAWVYGTGFPKSHDVLKSLLNAGYGTEQALEWDGWGTALKPAWEPICLARKPLVGTVAQNVLRWGTGALNINASRVHMSAKDAAYALEAVNGFNNSKSIGAEGSGILGGGSVINRGESYDPSRGRWPANFAHDGSTEVVDSFPDAMGQQGHSIEDGAPQGNNVFGAMTRGGPHHAPRVETDKSASRFFYCAKASKRDRNEGLDQQLTEGLKNKHPTVKPTALMQWLCRMITPPGGLILDPFMGSGSTGKAAVLEGFNFTGVEMDPEYIPIAEARIAAAVDHMRDNEGTDW